MPTAYSYDLTHSRDLAVVPQLANSSLAIHSRWWCIFEAHVAVQCALSVCIAGRPLQLLTGSLKDTLQLKESAVMRVQQDTEKEVRDIAARGVASPILTSLLDQMHQAKQEEAQAKLDVLVAKDSELIDLDRAECFSAADKKMILAEVDGHRRVWRKDSIEIRLLECVVDHDCDNVGHHDAAYGEQPGMASPCLDKRGR